VTAAAGLAVGCGYVFVAVCTVAVAMFALHVLGSWERRMQAKDRYVRLSLRFARPAERLEEIVRILSTHTMTVLSHTVDWDAQGTTYNLQLRYARRVNFERATAGLRERFEPEGLSQVEWS